MYLFKKSSILAGVFFALIIILMNGCAGSLTRSERLTLRELKKVGISSTEIEVRSPWVAGGLNIVGLGNFYLGQDEAGVFNTWLSLLCIWAAGYPIPAIWAVPQGIVDARTFNKRATVEYFTVDPWGIAELEALKKAQTLK